MDDATRLITDLQQKLTELDHKVAAYRQDMATEFKRYSGEMLESVPEDVSVVVERAITRSIANYPALSPAFDPSPDSPPPASNWQTWHGKGSPPPSPLRRQFASEGPSAHNREKEFQGLFTPSYLPLLDGGPALPMSPTSSAASQQGDRMEGAGIIQSGQSNLTMDKPDEHSGAPSVVLSLSRPNHVRRATDETTSSVFSDRSDSKMRRSALRRSSSGSKPPVSPRRVRFEFDGGEVLPTASPQSPSLVPEAPEAPAPPSPIILEDDSISAEILLGPDEINEPPPKKVSSSQALRALSRIPLDTNTVWTEVNAGSPQTPAATGKETMISSASASSMQSIESADTVRATSAVAVADGDNKAVVEKLLGKPDMDVSNSQDNGNDDSSEDDFLSMAKPKSFASKKPIQSPSSRSPANSRTASPGPSSPTADPIEPVKASERRQHKDLTADSNAENDEDDEDDDMFLLEGLSAPPKPRARPSHSEEEEKVEEEVALEISKENLFLRSPYSSSPIVSIPHAAIAATISPFAAGSLGSYRGRPVTMPIVTNAEVYEQAASLAGINTFIGGLDGRSGVDDGDMNSYRASVGQVHFSGTPRSLTERMMMEEAHAQRRPAAQRQ